ncbi:hypothetical protein, partial [Pseudomonas aeruginosa]
MNKRKAPIGAFFFSGERMLIQKLEDAFFNENVHLEEVLDKRHGQWDGEKKRGCGILLIEHNNLRFGIPLRSHISHSACFKTIGTKGLDFSKAGRLQELSATRLL